jgi:hypothetical protein
MGVEYLLHAAMLADLQLAGQLADEAGKVQVGSRMLAVRRARLSRRHRRR